MADHGHSANKTEKKHSPHLPIPLMVGAAALLAVIIIVIAVMARGGSNDAGDGDNSSRDAPADQTAAGTDVTFVSTPVEANRYLNDAPTPVNIPATGHSGRFPISRTHRTCPSEYPQEFGYRTICHRRGTPDSVTSVYDEDDRDSCPETDWIAYESTDGQAKQMELNYVRDAEACPV